MANDTDRRAQILDAALTVFSEHGFHKASIKQIASAAGLKSTSHIYWYFEDKRALLNAVVSEVLPMQELPIFDEDTRQAVMDYPPRSVLKQIGMAMLGLQDDPRTAQLIRLYISEAIRTPEVADIITVFQRGMLSFLKEYLAHQADIGVLQPHNPDTAARLFVGVFLINIFANNVFPRLAEGLSPREQYIDEALDMILNGLEKHDT